MELQEGWDADRWGVLPEDRTHDFLGGLIPTAIGGSIWIGIGKQNDSAPSKGAELVYLDFAQSACCQPDILRVKLRENHSRFLGFDNSDVLLSSGAGLRVQLPHGIVFKVAFGVPLRHNKYETKSGGAWCLELSYSPDFNTFFRK